jgi:hypothetical protein
MSGAPAPRETPDAPGAPMRRLRDAALGLPVLGVLLFLSPLASIFAVEGRVLGVPVVVAYVFLAWAGLIVAAAAIGRRMLRGARSAGEAAGRR